MVDSYVFSFYQPVTLAWLERCVQESFSSADAEELVVYPEMGDIGLGKRTGERAKKATRTVSLAALRRLAHDRGLSATQLNVNEALNRVCH